MTGSFVIVEKSSQKRNVLAAIGNAFGPIVAMEGHCGEAVPPPGYDDWEGLHCLVPESRKFDWRPTTAGDKRWQDLKKSRLAECEKFIRTASRVIIATDDDEEGEWIGWFPLVFFGFRGQVLRARFNREDPKTLKEAFQKLEDGRKYWPRAVQARTRAEADMAWGYSVTAAATVCLRPPGAPRKRALNNGRVKNGIVDMLCGLEHEIRTFVPVPYFELDARTDVAGLSLRHAPSGEARILDRARAEAIQRAAEGFSGPVNVSTERKHSAPPIPFSMSDMEREAGIQFGWEADKTNTVGNKLYREHCIISYPRSDYGELKDEQVEEIPPVLEGLRPIFSSEVPFPAEPIYRKSVFNSDILAKGNSAHHGIIPNVRAPKEFSAIWAEMNSDERSLFRLIALRTIACVSPDYEYDSTTVRVTVPTAGGGAVFSTSGSVPKVAGWKAVWRRDVKVDQEDEDDADGASSALPPITQGQVVTLSPVSVVGKQTEAPKRIRWADLTKEMKHAHRHVRDESLKKLMQGIEGLGTQATRASIVKESKDAGIIEKVKGFAVPTERTYTLWTLMKTSDPDLYNLGMSVLWDKSLKSIGAGALAPEAFHDSLATDISFHIGVFRNTSPLPLELFTDGKGNPVQEVVALPGDGEPCPKCQKGKLETKVGGKSGQRFLGCNRYKEGCDFAKWPDQPEAEPLPGHGKPCPVCNEGVMTTKTWQGKRFLGCSRYKDGCKHSEWPDDGQRQGGGGGPQRSYSGNRRPSPHGRRK